MHHDILKLLSPIASDAHVHHFRQRSGKILEPVTNPLIRRTGDGKTEGRLRGRELRHGSRGERGRKADKARKDNSNTPQAPLSHGLCLMSDGRYTLQRLKAID